MSGVAHYSDLVEQFHQEHRRLLKAFGQVKHGIDGRDAPAFKQALKEFQSLLVPHLVTEGYKLYTYLRQRLKEKGERADYDRVNGYKSEMARIGDTALRYAESYLALPDAEIDFSRAGEELREIGLLLGDRIQREESDLYRLYQSTV